MRALLYLPAAALVLFACSSDDDKNAGASSSSSSSSSSTGGPDDSLPPDPAVLFDALPAGSPDKLRGVWETKETGDTGSITIRLRFTSAYVAGVARCVTPAGKSLDAVNVVGIETADVENKQGSFAMPAGIQFAATEGELKCSAEIPGGKLAFAITGAAMALSLEGEEGSLAFTKVGD